MRINSLLRLMLGVSVLAGAEDIRPYLRRGLELGKQGKWVEAIDQLRRAAALEPASPEAHYSLGVTLFWTRQFSEAREELEQTLRLSPTIHPFSGLTA